MPTAEDARFHTGSSDDGHNRSRSAPVDGAKRYAVAAILLCAPLLACLAPAPAAASTGDCVSASTSSSAWDNARNGMNGTPTPSHARALYRALLTFEQHGERWTSSVPAWPARHGAQPTRTITAQKVKTVRADDPWSGWDRVIVALEEIEACRGALPVVSIAAGAGVTEGALAQFTFSVDPAPQADLTLEFTIAETGDVLGTTGAGSYQITYAAGATSEGFYLATVDDATDEPDGTVSMTIDAGTGYTVAAAPRNTASVAVSDDDAAPPVNAYAELIAKMVEWRNDSRGVNNKPHRDRWDRALLAFGESVADSSLTPMTATEAQAFADRGWTRWVEVATALQEIEDGGQTEKVTPVPELSLSAGSVVNEGGDAEFTITADTAPTADLTVNYTVAESGAVLDAPGAGNRTATLSAGATTATVAVATDDDATDEPDGSVSVTVDTGTGYTVAAGGNTGTVTVRDDDTPVPELRLSAGNPVTEGTPAIFTVTATPAPAAPLTVALTVAESADHAASGQTGARTVTIATSGSVNLQVATVDDATDEPDGMVSMTIDAGTGYTVAAAPRNTASVAVRDDDAAPPVNAYAELIAKMVEWRNDSRWVSNKPHRDRWDRALLAFGESVADSSLTPMTAAEAQAFADRGWTRWVEVATALQEIEDGGQTKKVTPVPELSLSAGSVVNEGGDAEFTITADTALTADLTVKYTVAESGAVLDAPGAGNRTATLSAGATTVTVAVATDDDATDEPDGSVSVTVDTGTGYTVAAGGNTGTVTVRDDDTPVPELRLSAGNPVTEGTPAIFTVTATPAPAAPLMVALTVTESADHAASGQTGARTVTIATSGSVNLQVATVDDATDEPDGTVSMTVDAGTGYTVAAAPRNTASVAVRDDDTPVPELRLSAGTPVTEGTPAIFTVTATPAPAAPLTVALTVTESADHAASGQTGARTVTVATSGSVNLQVATVDDATDEPDGTVSMTIDAGTGYTVAAAPRNTASVAVSDDDAAPPVNPDTACVSAVLQSDVEGYAAEDQHGPAHVARWKKVLRTFAGDTAGGMTGAEARQMEAKYSGNRWQPVAEAIECLEAARQPPPATVPELSLAAGSAIDEGASATFTIAADTAPQADLTVNLTVAESGDWLDSPGSGSRTVTLVAGETSITLSLATLDDGTDESDGSVSVTLDVGTDYSVAAGQESGTVAVRDNDDAPVPVVSISAGSGVTEGAPANFSITANPVPASPLDVTLTVGQSGDFAAAGETGARTVTVPVSGRVTLAVDTVDDATDEPDGSVTATLAAGNGHTVAASPDDTASVTVADDDAAVPAGTPTLSVSDATASENDQDCSIYLPCMAFTVTLSQPAKDFVSFTYRTRETTPVSASAGGKNGVDYYHLAGKGVIFPGRTEREIPIYLVEDTRVEGAETFELVVTSATGGVAIGDGVGVGTITDLDPLSTRVPVLSVDDAQAHENDRTVAFTVRLNRASDKAVRFNFATRASRPMSAQPGVDYWPWSGQYHFPPGETESRIMVDLMNDGHDEGPETFELWVTYADSGVKVVDSVGVGTIVNSDPMPKAWLARFGRTVAEHALDGIAGRMAAPRMAGAHGTLAGQTLRFGNPDGSGAANAAGPLAEPAPPPGGLSGNGTLAQSDMARANEAPADRFGGRHRSGESRTMSAHELLLGSSFTATQETDATGGSLALWGRAAQSSFDGREGAFSLDGETTTAMLGADYARDRWLVGVALTQSEGDGGYRDTGVKPRPASQTCPEGTDEALCEGAVREGNGEVEASLTAAIPYASLQASERLQLWGALGYGTGEVTLNSAMGRSFGSDISWTMVAAGARGDLLAPPTQGSGLALALTSDALWARTSSEKTSQLAASDSDVTRLRIGLEAGWRTAIDGGGHVTPKLEVGARHDGGDAETGLGVEVGGGLAWSDPTLGLALDLSGRTLIAHDSDDLKDRGFAASLAFDSDPATQRGASLTVSQDWGGSARGGLDALFASDPVDKRSGSEASSRWAAEAAYGFPAFGGAFTGSPQVGLGLATGVRDYTLGWRLAPAVNASAPDLSFGVEATRHESDAAQPEHMVGVEWTLRW